MEEKILNYAAAKKRRKKDNQKKFKKRLFIAGAVVGLSALLTNTLPIVEAIGGKRAVSEVSRYFPTIKFAPHLDPNPTIDFQIIFRDFFFVNRIAYMGMYKGSPMIYEGYVKEKITKRDSTGYEIKLISIKEKVFCLRE